MILGMKGQGKTTLAQQMSADSHRLFCLDPLSEYRDGLIFESVRALRHFFRTTRPQFRCIFRFDTEEEEEEAFALVWEIGRCLLLVEEADLLAPPVGGSRMFRKLVKYGRHRSINLLAISRRPAEISRLFSSQTDEIISFREEEENDLLWLSKRGFEPEALKALGVRQYLTNKHN